MKSCLFYLKDNDEQEGSDNLLFSEPIINMNYKNDNKKDDEEYQKLKKMFISNPFELYKIQSDISPNSKIVNFKDSPDEIRLMEIIPNKDEEKDIKYLNKIRELVSLDNDNIIKILTFYIYENNYYLIFEYIKENNLLGKINTSGALDKSETITIMNNILSSIQYLHELNIFNIGLKLDEIILIENSLIESEETKYKIKISLKNYIKEKYDINDINSFLYYPPEIIEQIENNNLVKRDYNSKLGNSNNTNDEWACGVIMYYLLTGEYPFKGNTKEEICSNIKTGIIDFYSPKCKNISEPCKDIISKLLEKDRNKRIKLYEFYNHLFLLDKNLRPEELLIYLKSLLKAKKPESKYHEIIIEYLCLNYIDEEEKNKLKDLFDYIDEENQNLISEENIKNALNKNNIIYSEEDIINILYVFDYDENNLITYEEFLNILCDKKTEHLINIFNDIDIGNKDYININDIKNFIAKNENFINKVKNDTKEPFGMKPDDKMNYIQFCNVIIENKPYE